MLDVGGLANDLEAVLSGDVDNDTFVAAAANWADFYDRFAVGGTANGVPVVTVGTERLAADLESVFSSSNDPSSCAGGMDTALAAYWAAATFAGMVAPPVPSLSLTAAMSSVFAVVGGTHASKATDIANALLAYTNGVLVTFPIIGPFPVV